MEIGKTSGNWENDIYKHFSLIPFFRRLSFLGGGGGGGGAKIFWRHYRLRYDLSLHEVASYPLTIFFEGGLCVRFSCFILPTAVLN